MSTENAAIQEAGVSRTELASSGAVVVDLIEYRDQEAETKSLDADEPEMPQDIAPIPKPIRPPVDLVTFPLELNLSGVNHRELSLLPPVSLLPEPSTTITSISGRTAAGRAYHLERSLGRRAA